MLAKYLSPENKALLIAKAKKLAWRGALYSLVVGSAFVAENLQLLELHPALTLLLGAVLGEVHSWAESKYDMSGKVAAMFGAAR